MGALIAPLKLADARPARSIDIPRPEERRMHIQDAMVRICAASCVIAALAGSVPASAGEPRLQFYTSPAVAAANPPFSQAVRVGDILYLSGTIGIVPGTGALAAGGIEAEARQAMENMGAVVFMILSWFT
jgi:enamine deaminase RidA (YjgF/YER057c/UK114 family)